MKEEKNGFKLTENDIIKLGRVIFKIKYVSHTYGFILLY